MLAFSVTPVIEAVKWVERRGWLGERRVTTLSVADPS